MEGLKFDYSRLKLPGFIVLLLISTGWNIVQLSPYFKCLEDDPQFCPTSYLYIPPNVYHHYGKFELFILVLILFTSIFVVYKLIMKNTLSWKTVLVQIVVLYLSYYFLTTVATGFDSLPETERLTLPEIQLLPTP